MTILPAFTKEFTAFVARNLKENPSSLRLKHHGKAENFDVEFAITQIECRQKTKRKLKSFIANENFIFPTQLAAEQASHEAVARYHASLVGEEASAAGLGSSLTEEGVSLLDLTAGLGIDVMSMASHCSHVTACELDEIKAEALIYNRDVLGLKNISVVTGDSTEWLSKNDQHFDLIFIDPARRGEDNARTYNFHDCQPDILKLQEILPSKTSRLLIKASPLLDITQTVKDIHNIRSIRAICVNGECKEVLIEATYPSTYLKSTPITESDTIRKTDNIIERDPTKAAEVIPESDAVKESKIIKEAIDLNDDGTIISKFTYSELLNGQRQDGVTCAQDGLASAKDGVTYAVEADITPGSYLYEPNAAVMKFAPWSELCQQFDGLKKIAPSSHLFVSKKHHPHFPGRILKIEKKIEKKDRKTLKNLPVNVAVRNYPLSAVELRKQLKVKEGSDLFIYGTRLSTPLLILARKILEKKEI